MILFGFIWIRCHMSKLEQEVNPTDLAYLTYPVGVQALQTIWQAALSGDRVQMRQKIRKHAVPCGTLHPEPTAETAQVALGSAEYVSPHSLVMDVALAAAGSPRKDHKLAAIMEDLLRNGWPLLAQDAHLALIELSKHVHSKHRIILLMICQLPGLNNGRMPGLVAAMGAAAHMRDTVVATATLNASEKARHRLHKLMSCQMIVPDLYERAFGTPMSRRQFKTLVTLQTRIMMDLV